MSEEVATVDAGNTLNPDEPARSASYVRAAKELAPLIRTQAEATDYRRRLAPPVVDALRSAGLFTMGLPASLGGLELPLKAALQIIEAIACADGATGWNVMILFDAGLSCGTLRAVDARSLITSLPQPVLAVGPGNGQAIRTEGGSRLTGRWRFVSGCQHADAFIATGTRFEGGRQVCLPDGTPEEWQFVLPAADVEILDTWKTLGLHGTGSHDVSVQDRFVADGYAQPLDPAVSVESGPLYSFPEVAILASAKAGVALGIVRHALDTARELAQARVPMGEAGLLCERGAVQRDVAQAEALVQAGRAFLYTTVDEAWADCAAGRAITPRQQAILRLAAVDGVQRAVQAVDLIYNATGAVAISDSSPLERCFRDAHMVPAHVVVSPSVYEVSGRVLLGLAPGTTVW